MMSPDFFWTTIKLKAVDIYGTGIYEVIASCVPLSYSHPSPAGGTSQPPFTRRPIGMRSKSPLYFHPPHNARPSGLVADGAKAQRQTGKHPRSPCNDNIRMASKNTQYTRCTICRRSSPLSSSTTPYRSSSRRPPRKRAPPVTPGGNPLHHLQMVHPPSQEAIERAVSNFSYLSNTREGMGTSSTKPYSRCEQLSGITI